MQGTVHQRNPLRVALSLVPGDWSAAVSALNHLAPPLTSLTSAARLSLLRQTLSSTVNSRVPCLNVVVGTKRGLERLVGFGEVYDLRSGIFAVDAA